MEFLSILILAAAVSLDSFGIGITYGLRRMKIGSLSLLVIVFCTAVTLAVAMWIGQEISEHLSPLLARIIGGLILIGLGGYAVYTNFRSRQSFTTLNSQDSIRAMQLQNPAEDSASLQQSWLHKLGEVGHILQSPLEADFDHSGRISADEALILGIAVSMDSFVAGIGAGLMGYSFWMTLLIVALMSGLLIVLGTQVGILLSRSPWMKRLPYMPGILLIALGISKFV